MFKIIDNFLDDNKFNQINCLVKSSDFHWNLTSSLNENSNDGDWQGYHLIVEEGIIISPNSMFMVDRLVECLQKVLQHFAYMEHLIRQAIGIFVVTPSSRHVSASHL